MTYVSDGLPSLSSGNIGEGWRSPGGALDGRWRSPPSRTGRGPISLVPRDRGWTCFHSRRARGGKGSMPIYTSYIWLALALILFLMTVRVCNQYQRAVVFFLGRYSRTSGP